MTTYVFLYACKHTWTSCMHVTKLYILTTSVFVDVCTHAFILCALSIILCICHIAHTHTCSYRRQLYMHTKGFSAHASMRMCSCCMLFWTIFMWMKHGNAFGYYANAMNIFVCDNACTCMWQCVYEWRLTTVPSIMLIWWVSSYVTMCIQIHVFIGTEHHENVIKCILWIFLYMTMHVQTHALICIRTEYDVAIMTVFHKSRVKFVHAFVSCIVLDISYDFCWKFSWFFNYLESR